MEGICKPVFHVTDLFPSVTPPPNEDDRQNVSERKTLILKAYDATNNTSFKEYEKEVEILSRIPDSIYALSLVDHGECYEGMAPITYRSGENKTTTFRKYCFIITE